MNVGKANLDLISYVKLQWTLPSDYTAASLSTSALPEDCALTLSFFGNFLRMLKDFVLTSVHWTSGSCCWKEELRKDDLPL